YVRKLKKQYRGLPLSFVLSQFHNKIPLINEKKELVMKKMFTKGWSVSYMLQNRIETLFHPYKTLGKSSGDKGKLPGFAVNNNNQGLRFISNNMGFWRKVDTNISAMKDVRENDHSPAGAGSGLPWCSFSR
ncbi:hypothetical protein Gorai_017300, partial [Gossypium raimondii]|nr:hypothetical protein [Gossypium raimondii]